jgi:hypothetical protein
MWEEGHQIDNQSILGEDEDEEFETLGDQRHKQSSQNGTVDAPDASDEDDSD